jgi:hypothetical protein
MNSALKSAVLALVLFGVAAGVTACAKYPVVSDARASSPSAAVPTR